MKNSPNKNIYECVEGIRALCNSIRFEASLLTKEDVDLNVVADAIRKRCDDIDEARRALEYHSGIASARDNVWMQLHESTGTS